MNKQYFFVNNLGVKIHCVQVNPNLEQIPLIIIPGATNSLEEIEEDLKGALTDYHIIISLRGRGNSDSPENGYSIDNHAADVIAVIEHFNLNSFYLFGHSVGASVCIRVATLQGSKAKGLVLGDFPPFFPPFDKSWADHVLKNPKVAISKTALYGLAKEGRYVDLSNDFKHIFCPILLIRGGQKDSAFPEKQVPAFKAIAPTCIVQTLPESGHDIFRPNPTQLVKTLTTFMLNSKSTQLPL